MLFDNLGELGLASGRILFHDPGTLIMHSVTCPNCQTEIKVDFIPIAGMVNCPTCQKPFFPKKDKNIKSEEPDHSDHNGKTTS